MTDRERLIEVIKAAPTTDTAYGIKLQTPVQTVQTIADNILADGWIRPPCKIGDLLFCVITETSMGKTYNRIEACKVEEIMHFANDSFLLGVREINNPYGHNVELGKNAFKEVGEVEEKLKELKERGTEDGTGG